MSKPLTIQYTGKYANYLLKEKEKEIKRLKNIINEIEKERCNLHNSNGLLENAIHTLQDRNEEIYEGFMATQEELKEYAEENEQLHSIIKEVRKYANKYNDKIQKDILEILDKVGDEK